MEQIGCRETSVRNDQYSLPNSPLHRSYRLRFHKPEIMRGPCICFLLCNYGPHHRNRSECSMKGGVRVYFTQLLPRLNRSVATRKANSVCVARALQHISVDTKNRLVVPCMVNELCHKIPMFYFRNRFLKRGSEIYVSQLGIIA